MYHFKGIPCYFLGRLHISLGKISIRLFSNLSVFYKLSAFITYVKMRRFMRLNSLDLKSFVVDLKIFGQVVIYLSKQWILSSVGRATDS